MGVSEGNDSFEGTGGDNKIVIDLTDDQYQTIINNTEKRIGNTLNSYKNEMTKLNDNNGRDSTVVSKVTKATQNSAVHSISSTIVSEYMNRAGNNLTNLIGTNRNKYVLSMFDMISKGYNFNKKKLREDIAAGSGASGSLKTNNLKQMQQCWGTKVTQHFAYTNENGGEGFCYLCSGKITPGENSLKYSPEVEHKMPCVLFYSQVYNLNHYPVLKKIWIEFIDNNEDVFNNMKDLYSLINYKNKFDNDIEYSEYKEEINYQYQDIIYTEFKKYVEVNYKKYKTLIRDEKREQYLKEFQGLLKCYLLEFSWSHHTCNQAKTNYNFTNTEDVNSYISNLSPIGSKTEYPRGAVMKKKFVAHEKIAIQDGFASDKKQRPIDEYTNTYVLPQITALSDSINEYAHIVNLTNKRLFIRSLKRITLSSMKGGKRKENKSITNFVDKEKTFNTKAKNLKNEAFGSFIVNNSKETANYHTKLTQVFSNIEKYDVYLLMTLINDILSYSNFMNVIIGLFLAVSLCIETSTETDTTFRNAVYNATSYNGEILKKVKEFLQNNYYYEKVSLLHKECEIILNNYDKDNKDKNTKIVKRFIKNIRKYISSFNSEDKNIRKQIDDILPKINNQIGGKRKRRYKMRKTRRKSKVSKKKTLRFKYKI